MTYKEHTVYYTIRTCVTVFAEDEKQALKKAGEFGLAEQEVLDYMDESVCCSEDDEDYEKPDLYELKGKIVTEEEFKEFAGKRYVSPLMLFKHGKSVMSVTTDPIAEWRKPL